MTRPATTTIAPQRNSFLLMVCQSLQGDRNGPGRRGNRELFPVSPASLTKGVFDVDAAGMFWKTRKKEVPAVSEPATRSADPAPNRLEVSLDDPADVTRALQVLGRIVGRRGGRPRKQKTPAGDKSAAAATAPPAPPAPPPAQSGPGDPAQT